MTVYTIRRVTWFLHKGDDWEADESFFVTDDKYGHNICTYPPIDAVPSGFEISICRGKLDFTPDLRKVKTHLPQFYNWLINKYEEPERMKGLK